MGRAALVTDIMLVEDFPSNYLVHARRQTRWVRGDWQLLPWLFGTPTISKNGTGAINNSGSRRLSVISRWKIFDNLRRSLAEPALFLYFIAAWLWFPGSTALWTLAGALSLGVPVLSGVLDTLRATLGNGRNLISSWTQTGNQEPDMETAQPLRYTTARWLIALTFLPYVSLLHIRAILSTLFRLFITHKHMLRWTTSAQAARHIGDEIDARFTWGQMFGALALSACLAMLVGLVDLPALGSGALLLAAWLASPVVAQWLSRPSQPQPQHLDSSQIKNLHGLARLTWLFFERFVGPEDHWLPPDHFQENPLGIVAHRTSPTNIGLLLSSTLAAYDLGYVDLLNLGARLQATMENMEKLERYRGHFLNWYDTHSLAPLVPRYVSTVDSGNLAACLIGMAQGANSMADRPLFRKEAFQGLSDTIGLVSGLIDELEPTGELLPHVMKLKNLLNTFDQQIDQALDRLERWPDLLRNLSSEGWQELDRVLIEFVEAGAGSLGAENLGKLRAYTHTLRVHLDSSLRELDLLASWVELLAHPPAILEEIESPVFAPEGPPENLPATLEGLLRTLHPGLSLGELNSAIQTGEEMVGELKTSLVNNRSNGKHTHSEQLYQAIAWCDHLKKSLEDSRAAIKTALIGFQEVGQKAEEYVREMDFSFLYDSHRQVFHIGYNVASGKLDGNYYDLLASEARITSLIAIAKGDVPQSHWLHMARPLTLVGGQRVLLSWSATMFEYLMPILLAPCYEGTLLQQSARGAVKRQIQYGQEKGVPWGISESGYYRFDANQFYQYKAFGVPGLGYKRGVGDDLVITPYASLMALPLEPQSVAKNVDVLSQYGLKGLYGFYEAVDFTPKRAALGEKFHIIRSFMAHHQGMIFLSLANHFTGQATIKRFHSDPRIRAIDLLLQEQTSLDAPLEHPLEDDVRPVRPADTNRVGNPWRVRLQAPQPRVHFLSNGRYGVLVTSAGGGYSTWQDIDLTRWREDTTRSNWGTWIYIQDEDNGNFWSVGYQPANVPTGSRDVYFNAHVAELHRRDYEIGVAMEITVPPGDDLEVRMVSLTNYSDHRRRLKLISYGEVVMSSRETDRRHPAFNKLFIESEYASEVNALLFKRRPRSEADAPVFMGHALVVGEGLIPSRAYESDRMRFIGRGKTTRAPHVLLRAQQVTRRDGDPTRPIPGLAQSRQNRVLEKLGVRLPGSLSGGMLVQADEVQTSGRLGLSGTTGGTLDPIFALGQEIELEAHASCQVVFITAAAKRREELLATLRRYQSWHVIRRSFEQARQAAEIELRQLGLDTSRVQVIERLLSLMLYPHPALRARPERLAANVKGQSGLWPFAISGDYPILLLTIETAEDLSLVQEVLQAHAYWRNRRIKIDLVIVNEKGVDYGQELNHQLHDLLQHTSAEGWLNRRGGIFILVGDQIKEAERILLESSARAILKGKDGTLAAQLERMMGLPIRLPVFVPPMHEVEPQEATLPVGRPQGLMYFNGLGGFSQDGKEYCIYLEQDRWTPAPWINVIANPVFGFLVSEAGSGSTWAENSGENRLTPWNNDPVCDQPGEALYLRDEETGVIWSPTPLPVREPEPYLVRHGAGYSTFEHNSHGLKQRLKMFVPMNDPVKIYHLHLENIWNRARRITVTFYAEWVLGVHRDVTKLYLVPEFDGESQALLVRNTYNEEFNERVGFAAASKKLHGLTANRTEFLGRLGGLARPAALTRIGLGSQVEAGFDPCAALQLHVDLPPGDVEEVFFIIGEGDDREDALHLVRQYQQASEVENAWNEVTQSWDELLGNLRVSTPDPAMDLMLNRWLLYQTVACRLWGRTALYQSSGAYGFRDQLQDVLALKFSDTQQLREQILRAADRQFEAGDVLHWWHPPSGRGVRTRISDDMVWLPYVVAEYIQATGDENILNEKIPFIKAPPLELEEDERYSLFPDQSAAFTLYEHCLRALKKAATHGPHQLPLIGTGDWNDGLNKVGRPVMEDDQREGRGESIWLAWFLYAALQRFAPICESRGDGEMAAMFRSLAEQYRQSIASSAWDGQWYLRAFYDDGSPLGSRTRRECQIDSIAQSWAVLSGAGNDQRFARRAPQAMQEVMEKLVDWDERLVLLFTPPFNRSSHNPGYIKGYLPGIRENGGQYTHAAIWTAWAMAELGDGDTAGRLFRTLNPISHSEDPALIQKYRVEPYVIAADIYSIPPHKGRGGWTWYTGSAGWMYRLGVERILGLRVEGEYFRLDPCIPKEWKSYRMIFRHCGSSYEIQVENPSGVNRGIDTVEMDGKTVSGDRIQFAKDGGAHRLRVLMGEKRE